MLETPVPLTDLWKLPGREARRIVDLDAIARNVEVLKSSLTPGARLMAVVKANAYGHGDVIVSRIALENGAEALGVATMAEALRLRNAGLTASILCLGPTNAGEMLIARREHIAVALGSRATLHDARLAAQSSGHPLLRVHIKVNTGMNRYGVEPEELANVFRTLGKDIIVEGVFAHFARSDEATESTMKLQLIRFQKAVNAVRAMGYDPGKIHVANSAALLRGRETDFNIARAGIAMYGVSPSAQAQILPGMRQAMTVVCRSQRISTISAGETVGYGGTFAAKRQQLRIGLLPIGYADGLPRQLSNRGTVWSHGNRYPYAGRISMDQATIFAPKSAAFNERQTFTVLGDGRSTFPSIEEFAELCDTIPYEVLVAFGLRLPVCYVQRDSIVAYDNNI